MTSRRVLVTGFQPFGGHETNPSGTVALALAGPRIHAAILPVDFTDTRRAVEELLEEPWSAVVMLGLAANRSHLGLEKVAINYRQRMPDTTGQLPTVPEVVPGGPAAYFSTLPIEQLAEKLSAADLPVEISLSAGGYLCNEAFYVGRHRLEGTTTPCGFIHLPPTPDLEGSGAPMNLEDQVRAIRIVTEHLAGA